MFHVISCSNCFNTMLWQLTILPFLNAFSCYWMNSWTVILICSINVNGYIELADNISGIRFNSKSSTNFNCSDGLKRINDSMGFFAISNNTIVCNGNNNWVRPIHWTLEIWKGKYQFQIKWINSVNSKTVAELFIFISALIHYA